MSMRLHRFQTALPFLLAVLLAACAQPSLRTIEEEAWREGPGEEVLSVSEADLALVGERLAARRRHAPLRVEDARLEQAIRAVACRLDAERCPRLQVQLWNSPLPAIACWPNGLLELSTGTLLRAVDEDELAALLAHALAHDRLGHRARAVQAAQRALWPHTTRTGLVQPPEVVVLGSPYVLPTYSAGLVVGYGRVAGAMAGTTLQAAAMPAYAPFVPFVPILMLREGAAAFPIAIDVDLEIAQLPFAPALEIEADRQAALLLERAGYDASVAAPLWARFAHERGAEVRAPDERPFIEIHPVDPRRLGPLTPPVALRTTARTRREEGWSAVLAARRTAWLAREIGRGNWSASLALVDDLLAREPAASDLVWAQAELLRRRGEAADLETARASLERLVREPRAPIAAWRSLGLVHDRQGRHAAATAAYREFLARAPSAPERALLEYRVANENWPFDIALSAERSDRSASKFEPGQPARADRRHRFPGTYFDVWTLYGKNADVTVIIKGLPPGGRLAEEDSPAVEVGAFPSPAPHTLPPSANPLEIVDLIGTLLSAGGADAVELLAVDSVDFAGGTGVRAEWRIREHVVGVEQRALAVLRTVDGSLVGLVFRAATFGPWAELLPKVETFLAAARVLPGSGS